MKRPGMRIGGLGGLSHCRVQNLNGKCYVNRSFLRPYLLGYSTKKYLKTIKNRPGRAFSIRESRLKPEKSIDFRKKSGHSRLFTGLRSYEINSKSLIKNQT